jgi:hypothetical protein
MVKMMNDRLPGLTALLYTDLVERRLEPHIRQAGNEILDRRVAYIRYRPNGTCVVRYVITHQKRLGDTPQELFWYGVCFTPETFSDAHTMAVAKPWVQPTFGPPFIALTDYKTLLFAYPNDRRLDGLRILDREDTLHKFLCNHLPEERWPSADEKLATTVVRYKPENRAVLRCEAESGPQSSDAAVYLRVYTFLGLPYDDEMLRFHEGRERTEPGLDAKGAWQPVTSGLRDWRTQMSAGDVERFEAAVGGLLDELGYARVVPRPSSEALKHASRIRSSFNRDLRRRGKRVPEGW